MGRHAPVDGPHLGQQIGVVAGDDDQLNGQRGLVDGAQEGAELLYAAAAHGQHCRPRRVPAVGGAHFGRRRALAEPQIDGDAGDVDAAGGDAPSLGQRRRLGRRHQVEIDLGPKPQALQPGQVGHQHHQGPRLALPAAIVGQEVDEHGMGSHNHVGPSAGQHAADWLGQGQHFQPLHQARGQGGVGQAVAEAIEGGGDADDAAVVPLHVAQRGGHARLLQRVGQDGAAEIAIALLQRGHRGQRRPPVAQPGVVGQHENGATVVHNLLSVYRLRSAGDSRA